MKEYNKEALTVATKFASHGLGIFAWTLLTMFIRKAYNKPKDSPTYGKVTINFNSFKEMVFEHYAFHGITGSLIVCAIYDIYNYIKSLEKEVKKRWETI